MKLSITAQNGSLAGQRWEFADGSLTVGREEGSALRYDPTADRLVSKRHAVFQKEPDGFYVQDLKSTNGTFVNGFRVDKIRLQSGDAVQFGHNGPIVMVSLDQPTTAPAPPPPARMAVNVAPGGPPTPNWQAPTNVAPNQAATPQNINNWAQDGNDWAGQNYDNSKQRSSFGDSLTNRVLYNPEVTPSKSQTKKYVAGALAVIIGVFLALVITILTVLELSAERGPVVGIIIAIIAAIVAFLPAAIYVLPLLWLDRYDPEPPLALALAFAWGALVSIAFSLVVNTAVALTLGVGVATVVSAPIFEEASKGLAVLALLIFWRREFDGIVDGIVYAGVIALGFATVENVAYYGRGMVKAGSTGLVILFFLRGILSPFAHVIFTSMTGIGCGIARETHNQALRIIMPIAGYVGAVLLHMIWNGMASFGGNAFFVGYIIFEVPFFLLFVGFAAYIMRRENKILKQTLVFEVAKGVITNDQMEKATSIFKSLSWRLSGISNGKFRARSRFLRAVAKVGLAWWHVQRAQAAGGATMSFQQLPVLEKEVLRWREQI